MDKFNRAIFFFICGSGIILYFSFMLIKMLEGKPFFIQLIAGIGLLVSVAWMVDRGEKKVVEIDRKYNEKI